MKSQSFWGRWGGVESTLDACGCNGVSGHGKNGGINASQGK